VWHYYEGAPLDLVCVDAAFTHIETMRLGPSGESVAPVRVVPGGVWQAARSGGAYTLVGCTVAPGFVFEEFALLRDDAALAAEAVQRHPSLGALL